MVGFAGRGSGGSGMSGSRQRVEIACIVADHWRRAALDWGDQTMEGRVTAHPLCMVRAALDGETDPTMLGVDGVDADRIRQITQETS